MEIPNPIPKYDPKLLLILRPLLEKSVEEATNLVISEPSSSAMLGDDNNYGKKISFHGIKVNKV